MLSPQRRFFLYTAGKGRSRFTCFYKSWIRLNAPPRIPLRVKIRGTTKYADVVELVDSVDLGSSVFDVQVRVLSSAPNQYNPNQVFPVGDGFGFIVFFDKSEDTHFRNGVIKRPESKPRGPRKNEFRRTLLWK